MIRPLLLLTTLWIQAAACSLLTTILERIALSGLTAGKCVTSQCRQKHVVLFLPQVGTTQNGKTVEYIYCTVSHSVSYERGLGSHEENNNIAYILEFINNSIAFGLDFLLCHFLILNHLKQATAASMSTRKRLRVIPTRLLDARTKSLNSKTPRLELEDAAVRR